MPYSLLVRGTLIPCLCLSAYRKFDDDNAFDLGAFKNFVRTVVDEDLDIVPRQRSTDLLPVGVELGSFASTQSRKNNVGGHIFS